MLLESRWWWKCGGRAYGEWTYEGGRKRERVVTNGVIAAVICNAHVSA